MKNFQFTKEGIKEMLGTLENDWNERWDNEEVDNAEIIIDGCKVEVPLLANNLNQIIFMLKDMVVADITDEATVGNLVVNNEEIDKKFEALFTDNQ